VTRFPYTTLFRSVLLLVLAELAFRFLIVQSPAGGAGCQEVGVGAPRPRCQTTSQVVAGGGKVFTLQSPFGGPEAVFRPHIPPDRCRSQTDAGKEHQDYRADKGVLPGGTQPLAQETNHARLPWCSSLPSGCRPRDRGVGRRPGDPRQTSMLRGASMVTLLFIIRCQGLVSGPLTGFDLQRSMQPVEAQ